MSCAVAAPVELVLSVSVESVAVCASVAAFLEVSTIVAVAHAVIGSALFVSEVASVIPAASSVAVPAMASAIYSPEVWTSEVEVVAVRVACVDTEVPVACVPVQWTIEISCIAECAVLPVEQYVAEVEVTTCPVNAVQVVDCVYTHQIVKVHFVGSLILLFGEVQFVSHLVCQEQSLLACLFVTHCLYRCCHCKQCCESC